MKFLIIGGIYLFPVFIINQAYSQQKDCYPLFVPADSLVRYVKEKEPQTHIPDADFKRYYFDKSRAKNIDSAYWKCQKFLIDNLGMDVYCKYVSLSLSSFSIDNFDKIFLFTYYFHIPTSSKETSFVFYIALRRDSTVKKIYYPKNVPLCNGTPDCGYKFNDQDILEIARKKGYVNDSVKFVVEYEYDSWVLKTSHDNWVNTMDYVFSPKTGELIHKGLEQRID